MKSELEDAQKIAESRLAETQQLSQQIVSLKQDLEKSKLSNLQVVLLTSYCANTCTRQIPDGVVRETAVFKSLQTQYSILMVEHQQVRNCYEEAKRLLSTAKTQHIMQLEEIRSDGGHCREGIDYCVALGRKN